MDATSVINGGLFSENDIVVGATSGATGMLLSVATPSSGNTTLVFVKITGDFINGELLQVGGVTKGTMSGTAYIIMAGKLIDTYTTTPVLRKVPTDKKFIIGRLSVKESGDVDLIVGAANRIPAFKLMSVFNPIIKDFTIESAWTRC